MMPSLASVNSAGSVYERPVTKSATVKPMPATRPIAAIPGQVTPSGSRAPSSTAARTATSGLSRAAFAEQAREVQRLIAAGEAFEINLAHLLRTPWTDGGWALFERLVAVSPADHEIGRAHV